ncbi:YqzL family protein [Salsuginibacillus kocurii]|nr:YqzL family protein [Salsuginibacillus kocurii]
MLEFSWKVFTETGNIDAYLLHKEMEREDKEMDEPFKELELEEMDH